jgi:uncharacterized membrane protein YgcG
MLCPYCQNPLRADAAECPSCRLTFPRACSLLGALPLLHPTVADTARLMRSNEHTRIRKRIERLQHRFPQVVIQVVLHPFPHTHPIGLYAFWVFNGGGLAGHANRGRNNHAILLLVDPDRGESTLMPGYGLEPFLRPGTLEHLLELASPAWMQGAWAEGILRVLEGLDQLLESVAVPMSQAAAAEGSY